jgi:hypothetical protein
MVRRQAEDAGISVSAVIADELAATARRRAGQEADRWFEEEEGPLTPEELIEAERIWQAAEAHQRKMSEVSGWHVPSHAGGARHQRSHRRGVVWHGLLVDPAPGRGVPEN